jgi:prepilin-type N-terminal cleavage/methylation domain-containing protein
MALSMLRVFDMNTKKSLRRPYGMTLLESLVVMVLLAILVAMLAPAFRHARSCCARQPCGRP